MEQMYFQAFQTKFLHLSAPCVTVRKNVLFHLSANKPDHPKNFLTGFRLDGDRSVIGMQPLFPPPTIIPPPPLLLRLVPTISSALVKQQSANRSSSTLKPLLLPQPPSPPLVVPLRFELRRLLLPNTPNLLVWLRPPENTILSSLILLRPFL